jgi:alginate O-acetyltransferase complex protein AlgJ
MKIGNAMVFLAATVGFLGCARQDESPVRTLNKGYDRTKSRVLVREVVKPTRANLDYAAWVDDMILFDTAMVEVHPQPVLPESLSFAGLFSDIATSIESTPLSAEEQASPLAWKPVENIWLAWNFEVAGPLVSRVQQVSQARWGDTSQVSLPFQQVAALYLHRTDNGDEIWVRLEFQSWMKDHVKTISDRDGDGFPDVWAKLAAPELKPEMAALLRGDYTTKVLDRAEAVQWANELAALWYPVYNTDMVDLSREPSFPQSSTEPEIVKELAGLRIDNAFAVIRGRPFGPSLYLALVLSGDSAAQAKGAMTDSVRHGAIDSSVAVRLAATKDAIALELKGHGGSWQAWFDGQKPVRDAAAALASTEPVTVQSLQGPQGSLLFRRELDYVASGDLATLPAGESPIARIKSLRDSLAAMGIDFLFVPVPTKQDAFPGLLGSAFGKTEFVNPWVRKLLADLAEAEVETVDLWPVLRGPGNYRRQDTHWNPHGADLAAKALAARIRGFSWYSTVATDSVSFSWQDTAWTDLGDLHERLSPSAKSKYGPEKVAGRRLIGPDGKAWEDSDTASILLLGDSYLGIYQKVGPKCAGLPSLLAGELRLPVSTIMGWGGGPEAPRKLAARGPDALRGRRLVVWVMSVRDLFSFPGGWKTP